MKVATVIINNPPGAVILKKTDGTVVFDSRLPSQRLYMTGTTDLASASGTITTKQVLYGKTFAKFPYIRHAARLITPGYSSYEDSNGFWEPKVTFSQNAVGSQFFSGHFSSAFKSDVYFGNSWHQLPGVVLRYIYAVFENPVE